MSTDNSAIEQFVNTEYKYGFVSDIATDSLPPGLNEEVIRTISAKKQEPEFLLQWRLRAYRHWLTLAEPHWAKVRHAPIDYNAIIYFAAPKPKIKLNSLDEADPEPRRTKTVGGRGRGRGHGQRFRGHHLQGGTEQTRGHLLLVLRGGAPASRPDRKAPRLGGAPHR
jgi:hypothetical protein